MPTDTSVSQSRTTNTGRGARWTLGRKVVAATLAIVVGSSAILYAVLAQRERDTLYQAKGSAAGAVGDLLAAGAQAGIVGHRNADAEAELRNFDANPDIRCAAVWREGEPDPIAVLRRLDCHPQVPDEALLGHVRFFADRVEVAREVVSGRRRVGQVLLVMGLAEENAALEQHRLELLGISAALAAAMSLLLVGLARRILISPLASLAEAAARLELGERGVKVKATSRDEIGELANAWNAMGDAIAHREKALEAVSADLRELFDNMRQAILAFDREGHVVGETSSEARRIFGAGVAGKDIRRVLFPTLPVSNPEAQAFDAWIETAFSIPVEEWEDVERLAPREVILASRKRAAIPLEVEFRPVLIGKQIARVMLLATDVTEARTLRRAVQAQEEEHARKMATMRRLVAGGGQVFLDFIEGAEARLARSEELLAELRPGRSGSGAGKADSPRASIDEIFRHAHTIKGEARAFELTTLEESAAALEVLLEEARRADIMRASWDTALLGEVGKRLAETRTATAEATEIFVRASPIGRAALELVTVGRDDVAALTEFVAKLGALGPQSLAELRSLTGKLAARPFGEATASLLLAAPGWAEGEGKQVRFEVEGRDVRVPASLARVLPNVLGHLVRNAVAHGIEPPQVREGAGKERAGLVRLVAESQGSGVIVTVSDDGRGLDEAALRGRALSASTVPSPPSGPSPAGAPRRPEYEKGAPTRSDAAELAFAPGITTRDEVTAIAGRGVGLDAVRTELRAIGYDVALVSSARGLTARISASSGHSVAARPAQPKQPARPPSSLTSSAVPPSVHASPSPARPLAKSVPQTGPHQPAPATRPPAPAAPAPAPRSKDKWDPSASSSSTTPKSSSRG